MVIRQRAIQAEAKQERHHAILDAAERLLRLVNDILSLIRLEEGRASLAKKQIDMIHFLRHTTASMKHFAASRPPSR